MLELKNCKLRIKILRNSSKKKKKKKKQVEGNSVRVGSKQPLQQKSNPACFIGPVCKMVVL